MSITDKWNAVRTIVDAFEYVKTITREGDKKKSASALIAKLAPSQEDEESLNMLFNSLDLIANNANIRHYGVDQELVNENLELADQVFSKIRPYSRLTNAQSTKTPNSFAI